MKLEKFNDKHQKRRVICFLGSFAFIFIMIGVLLHKTFADYQVTKKFNVIEGTVKYEGTGDVYIAAYIDGVQTSGPFPSMADYSFDHAECNNNAVINFDIVKWKATVTELVEAKTKCNIYFKSRDEYSNMIYEMMVNLAKTDTVNLAYDDTADNNIRYIGAAPNNYVTFNNELWRIIGSFNNIDDGLGRTEWRTKIIRNASIGNKAWDLDSANSGSGINEWSTSDIKEYLNGTYLSGLTKVAKDMIGNTIWHTGTSGEESYSIYDMNKIYISERSNNTGKTCLSGIKCDDNVPRTTKWTGKIGLMYPSDYGYATGGETRSTCLNLIFYNWNNHSYCYNDDWLYKANSAKWTITPTAGSTGCFVLYFGNYGNINNDSANTLKEIYPVLYLSSNVYISSGSGTSTDPYQLAIQ